MSGLSEIHMVNVFIVECNLSISKTTHFLTHDFICSVAKNLLTYSMEQSSS